MERIRSFIAIDIPRELRVKIADVQRELKFADADVKWVRPDGIHLTLKFLGSVGEETLAEISLAIAPVIADWDPLNLRIHGLGCFPSKRKPRVIWTGVDQENGEVSSLQKAVENRIAKISPPEPRPFTPHLTLGRVQSVKGVGSLIQAIDQFQDVEIGIFRVEEVFLFKSELKPTGAIYSKLKTYPMR